MPDAGLYSATCVSPLVPIMPKLFTLLLAAALLAATAACGYKAPLKLPEQADAEQTKRDREGGR